MTARFLAAALALGLAQAGLAQDAPYRIIALGDMPYGPLEQVYPPFERLLNAINDRAPDLVLHVGDTKGGGACTDALLTDQLAYMNSVDAPLLYTPGDNEWTDCHRTGDDPVERLGFIRDTYFVEPDKSLGSAEVEVAHQGAAGYPENVRLRTGQIGVITAHVVGSNNGFEARPDAALDEFFARSAATATWVRESFARFADAEVIVLGIHADMFEFDFDEFEEERWLRHSGFTEFGEALKQAARQYGKPVLLVFGDSHRHVIFQPFPKTAPNVTAMEVYGGRDMHAVEITVRPGVSEPFDFDTVWNPEFLEQ